ncbi:MAG: UbiA family prenyltransferase [Deltaproteobacteria bacterium]|jgi:4-hydroxybenzoate polyprenyltransferase|nr:UbiA family prenyltransferase [Deltaproteobacteria bacterium]
MADAASYRLSRREGGNLITSMTLALALALPIGDVAYRLVFGILLNLFVYLLNDCIDVRIDLVASGRDVERTRHLHEHIREGWAVVIALGASLAVLGAVHSVGLLVVFAANASLIAVYSRWLKRLPGVDIVAMAAWGLAMAMVGFPLDSFAGWRYAGLLAILCAVTESVQVLRDVSSDRRAGLRTTAVVLGVGTTVWISRGLIVAAAGYTFLMLDSIVAWALLPALIVPLDESTAVRSWDRFRLIFGGSWIALLISLRFDLGPGGWLIAG